MCKFSNRLFTFIFLVGWCNAAPGFPFNRFMDIDDDYDYDLYYDQRQNGTENYRIRLDGFLIAFPPEADSDSNSYTDELVNILGNDFLGPFGKFDSSLQPESETSKYPYHEKDQLEDHKEKEGAKLFSSEQTPDKSEQISPKNAEVIISRSNLSKKRKTRFHIMNLLKLLRRNDEDQ